MKWINLAVCCGLIASCAPTSVSSPIPTKVRIQVGDPGHKIASFCISKNGQRVGDGECWTLANEAFKSAGATRPKGQLRVWGRVVNPTREALKPGDVIEFQNARFTDGNVTGSNHTVVVVKGGSREKFTIAEQNWGRKNVRVREMNLTTLRSGKATVYRPE